MNSDNNLMRALLVELTKREVAHQNGDSELVQPAIDGMHVENPVVVPGYDHEQIDAHLRRLCELGLVDTGGVKGGPLIGIYFSHVTPTGRAWLARA